MTVAEFRAAIAEATTAEQLGAIFDKFVATFTKLPNTEKDKVRKEWHARQAALGVRV
jgi:hypothetical protein